MTKCLAICAVVSAFIGCGGSYEAPPPAPECTPGNTEVMLVSAPPELEFPGCVELPCSAYCESTTSRQWCCWRGTVVR